MRFLPNSCALALSFALLGGALLVPASANPNIQSGASNHSTALFRKFGFLRGDAVQSRPVILPPQNSASASASRVAAQNTGPLTFTFSGFSDSQQNTLSNFLRNNYARMVALWGEPAVEQRGKNVVIEDGGLADAAYQPPALNSDRPGGTIYFRYLNSASAQVNTYNLTRLVLLSFWGAQLPSFDFNEARYVEPWIYGMSDAAALQIAYEAAGRPSDFDPSSLGGYLLPVYDFFNRPELSSAFIYPPNASGDDPILSLSDFRLTMAQAAFLKIAAENPNFYRDFNAAYSAQTQPRVAVSPQHLKNIAAGVVPNVEGAPFHDWARRQYALDASVTTGQKLYFGLLPLPAATAGDTRFGFNGYVLAFTTDAQGNETVSTGLGSVQALDENGVNLNSFSSELRASNVISFSTPEFLGQGVNGNGVLGAGFSNFGADKARVTLKIRFREAEATGYFPYGVAGSTNSGAGFYGATLGATSGNLSLNGQNTSVSRGAWNMAANVNSGPSVQTQIAFNGVSLRRNTAWFRPGAASRLSGFLLEVPPANDNLNFSIGGGSSRVRMVSFPIFPAKTDEAQMLNVAPESLELARYRPNLSPATRVGDALQFGISADRHEIYPHISTPVSPGKGYWLGIGTSPFSTTIEGGVPSTGAVFEVPIWGGWNQFGVPFNRDFAVGAVKVRYGGFAPVSLEEAQNRGWIAPGIWRWLPGGGYERVDVSGGPNLQRFEGYYIFANPQRGVSLVFEVGAQNTRFVSRSGWSVPLVASGAKTRDKSARFGVSSAQNVAKPPTGTRAISLRFVENEVENNQNGAAASGAGLAESFVAQISGVGVWSAVLDGTNAGERVTLSWGSLSGVPKKTTITLRDEKTGKSQRMLKNGRYSFTCDGAPRRFTFVVIAPGSASSVGRL